MTHNRPALEKINVVQENLPFVQGSNLRPNALPTELTNGLPHVSQHFGKCFFLYHENKYLKLSVVQI